MASKKQAANNFKSLRILGKKAQDLFRKAREELAKKEANGEDIPAFERPTVDATLVKFSPLNIMQVTLTIVGVLIAVWMIGVLKDKLVLLLLGFFVAAIIDPGVRSMERMGIPRGIGILLHYFLMLFVVMFLVVSLIPIIAYQIQQIVILINNSVNAFLVRPEISLPLVTEDVNRHLTDLVRTVLTNLSITHFTDALQTFSSNVTSIAQGSFSLATKVAGGVLDFIVNLVIVLVLAFFIQIEREHLRAWIRSFFSMKYRVAMDIKIEAIQLKISQWARGQILLGISIALLTFVALSILRIPYAITLAILAGFTEFIPYIGPLLAAIPAVLVSLTQGGFLWALIVAGVYYVIQWCENNLLVPLIMKRAVGLSPIAIILAMLMALSFPEAIHPILGLLLAVPLTTIIALFLDDLRRPNPPTSSR